MVDVIAIRKSTAQPAGDLLKRGDLFDIILIQVKGGSARGPSAGDIERLRKVASHYHAKTVAQFQWKKKARSQFLILERGLKWSKIEPTELFR